MTKFHNTAHYTVHDSNRSPNRNMPETCKFCAYSHLPSRSGDHCSCFCTNHTVNTAKDWS